MTIGKHKTNIAGELNQRIEEAKEWQVGDHLYNMETQKVVRIVSTYDTSEYIGISEDPANDFPYSGTWLKKTLLKVGYVNITVKDRLLKILMP
jgi:glucan phosphorylase